jgi:hypothetical protein
MQSPWFDRVLAMLARGCAFGAAGGAAAGAKPLTILFLGACAAAFYEGAGLVAKRYVPPMEIDE